MKKISVVFVLTLFFTLLGFNVNSASAYAPGCTATSAYSVTTGQSCGQVVSECAPGDLFSAVTGHPCSGVSQNNDSSAVAQFNVLFKNNFTIGAHGDDVAALQQFLKDQSYYFGKVDGKYGRISARAVKDFQGDNDLDNTTQTSTNSPAPVVSGGDASTTPAPTQSPSPVQVPTSNDSPSFTTISGPSQVLVSQSYTFNFSATDPNNDNLAWGVQWGDNTGTGSACPATQANNTFSASHAWNTVGVYTVKLAISDCKGHGAEKSFSVNVAANTSDSSSLSSTNTIYNSSSVSAATSSDSASSSAQASRVIMPGPTPVRGSTTVTVVSPNGGETWSKGTTQNIRWQDNITMPPCPTGLFCTQAMPVYKYDIKLLSYYAPCASNICPSYMIPSPRTIASGIYGNQDSYGFSYGWTIPNCTANNPCSSNFEIPEGSYLVQVCRSGTDTCDSSNNYFKVVNVAPVQNILPTINSFSPTSGPIGTQVTINGTGFTSGGIAYLKFGSGTIFVSPTSDTTITFTVPSSLSNCNTYSCTNVIIPVIPGSYGLTVINTNGGNAAANNFTVTAPAVYDPQYSVFDIDHNNVINNSDATCLANYLAGNVSNGLVSSCLTDVPSSDKTRFDVNKDGIVSVVDLNYLVMNLPH